MRSLEIPSPMYVEIKPGAVTANTDIPLPSYVTPAKKLLNASKLIAPTPTFSGDALPTHGHTSLRVLDSQTAADQTAFVGTQDGAGAAIGAKIGSAGGGTDYGVPSSSVSAGTPSGTITQVIAGVHLTVVSPDVVPSSGEIKLQDINNIRCGDDLTADDILQLLVQASSIMISY